jgi:lipopolysaccharide biosynthesis glycosyltransferase
MITPTAAIKPTTISVICGIDNAYSMPLATMMHSIFEHLSDGCEIQLFVIDGGIQPKNREKIIASLGQAPCKLIWVTPPESVVEQLKDVWVARHITPAAYYRLLMAEWLPVELDKVIYLDCDLLVMTDLKTLWDNDVQPYHLLAVQDMGIVEVSAQYGLRNYKALGIPPGTKYFNSGVMVVNLKKWREDNIGRKLIHYIENNSEFLALHDQDALNAVLFDKWGELNPAWNQMYHLYRFHSWRKEPLLGKARGWKPSPLSQEVYESTLQRPHIVHFTYYFKPWSTYLNQHRRSFYRYVDRTAWKGWRFPWWKASRQLCLRLTDYALRKTVGTGIPTFKTTINPDD